MKQYAVCTATHVSAWKRLSEFTRGNVYEIHSISDSTLQVVKDDTGTLNGWNLTNFILIGDGNSLSELEREIYGI